MHVCVLIPRCVSCSIMSALQSTAVPVPRTYCLCTDNSVIGTPFYVMAYVQGRIFKDPKLPNMSVCVLTRSLAGALLTHSITRSLNHLLNRSVTYLLTHSFTHSFHSLHSFIHSLTPLLHSLTHSSIHSTQLSNSIPFSILTLFL